MAAKALLNPAGPAVGSSGVALLGAKRRFQGPPIMRSVRAELAGNGGAVAVLFLAGMFCCAAAAVEPPALPAAEASANLAVDSAVPPEYRLSTLAPAIMRAPALPGVAALGAGQEVLFSLPAAFGFDLLSQGSLEDLGSPLDRPRATYRYTWFSRPSWDIKVGLSANIDPANTWQRYFSAGSDHLRAGSLPSMHFSSEGRLADRWLLSVSAEGMLAPRGQGLDMDLRVDYSLTRNVALFGSYRLTDSTGGVPEFYGFVPANSARFGVRLRF
jgi:hypothetical protein